MCRDSTYSFDPDPASTASMHILICQVKLSKHLPFRYKDDIYHVFHSWQRVFLQVCHSQHSRILPYASPLAIREPRHRRGSNMPAASNRKAYTRFEKQWPGMSVLVDLDVNSFGETHAMQLLLKQG